MLAHQLRAMASLRLVPKRRTVLKVPAARWPHAIASAYLADILGVVKAQQRAIIDELFPELDALLRTLRSDGEAERFDAIGEWLTRIMQRTERAVIPEPRIAFMAEQTALRVSRHTRGELQRQVQAVAKINLGADPGNLGRHIEAFVSDNVKLISKLTTQELDDVHGIVLRGARAGLRSSEVSKSLMERFDFTKQRATLIARDQVGKLNGEVTGLRQRALGIKRYRWATSRDERVRDAHKALDRSIQRWDKPPLVDAKRGRHEHPGGDFRCRCGALPIVEDVLVEAGLMDASEAP